MRTLTISKKERPFESDPVSELQWIMEVLGIPERFSRSYAEMLIRIARGGPNRVSTTTLADERGEKRTSLVYHVNRLINMGLVVREGRSLYLRASNFERTLEEIERDVLRVFEDVKKIAREVDEALGLPRR